jgi:hypothetical protein
MQLPVEEIGKIPKKWCQIYWNSLASPLTLYTFSPWLLWFFKAVFRNIGRFHPFYSPQRPLGRAEVWLYSVLDLDTRRGWGSVSRYSRFVPPGKTPYPLYRRLGGPQGRSGHVREISSPPGLDPRTVQPVGSRYIDWATRPTFLDIYSNSRHQPMHTIH